MPDSDLYERQFEALAESVLHDRPVSPNAVDGPIDQRILYAMHRLAQDGSRPLVGV